MISYICMPKSWKKSITQVIVGVDEAGRGPIAGPVAVGVVVSSPKGILEIIKRSPCELRDSKKLTRLNREKWYQHIADCKELGFCDFAVTLTSPDYIDKHGIKNALQKSVDSAFKKLKLNPKVRILLDAGLRPPEEFANYVAMVKGDEREACIAMASIIAKVTRDRHMNKEAKKYPVYGFESHMGYGTRAHYKAIDTYGPSPIHRMTFLKYLL